MRRIKRWVLRLARIALSVLSAAAIGYLLRVHGDLKTSGVTLCYLMIPKRMEFLKAGETMLDILMWTRVDSSRY